MSQPTHHLAALKTGQIAIITSLNTSVGLHQRLLQFSEQSGQDIMVGREEKQNGKTIFRGFTNKSS